MICFGIFFLKISDWPFSIILSESFEKRACILTAGKHIRAKYSLWSILLWSWNLYSWWKKCKTRKSGQKTQTHQNISRQSISFCCSHCWYLYYRGIQHQIKVRYIHSSSKRSSHCIFYYEFFVPQPTTQWRNNLAKGNFAQFIPIS